MSDDVKWIRLGLSAGNVAKIDRLAKAQKRSKSEVADQLISEALSAPEPARPSVSPSPGASRASGVLTSAQAKQNVAPRPRIGKK